MLEAVTKKNLRLVISIWHLRRGGGRWNVVDKKEVLNMAAQEEVKDCGPP